MTYFFGSTLSEEARHPERSEGSPGGAGECLAVLDMTGVHGMNGQPQRLFGLLTCPVIWNVGLRNYFSSEHFPWIFFLPCNFRPLRFQS